MQAYPITRLPRGPHGLGRDDVLLSQRNRLCIAALDCAAASGFQKSAVADIVRRAEVSRRTFYEIFDGKDDCFAAGLELAVSIVENRLDAAITEASQVQWWELVHTSLTAYLDALMSEPTLAYVLHVETLGAGTALRAQRDIVSVRFADRMRRACEMAVACGDIAQPPPDEVFPLLIGGIDDRIRDCLQTRGAEHLPDLVPALYRASLALFGRPESDRRPS